MADGGKDLPTVGDMSLENIEEDLRKLYLQTVVEAGAKGSIVGPQEIIEDFAFVISQRIGGKMLFSQYFCRF